MKFINIFSLTFLVLVMLVCGCKSNFVKSVRYHIDKYPVSVVYGTEDGNVHETEELVFKLDSAFGGVWLLNSNEFERVAVAGMDFDNLSCFTRKRQFRKRLEAINLPQIYFEGRSTTVSEAYSLLERMIIDQDPPYGSSNDDLWNIEFETDQGAEYISAIAAINISAWDVLSIMMDVTGMEIAVENGTVFIKPLALHCGMITRMYPVDMELREHLKGTSITNALSKMNYGCSDDVVIKYSPELNIIKVQSYNIHSFARFEQVLELSGFVLCSTGVFRFVTFRKEEHPDLFLINGETGESWRFNAFVNKEGKRHQRFELIWSEGSAELKNALGLENN